MFNSQLNVTPNTVYQIQAMAKVQEALLAMYAHKKCAQCPNIFYYTPRASRRFYGKVDVRLCPICKRENKRKRLLRASEKRKRLESSQDKRHDTHTTPKRKAYTEALDALLNYWQESKIQ